jgi:hypothetical protein
VIDDLLRWWHMVFIDASVVGSEQGGVYQRAFRGFRIEDWPAERIAEMHDIYLQIANGQICHKKAFAILLGPLWNYCRSATEQGNCAVCLSSLLSTALLFSVN